MLNDTIDELIVYVEECKELIRSNFEFIKEKGKKEGYKGEWVNEKLKDFFELLKHYVDLLIRLKKEFGDELMKKGEGSELFNMVLWELKMFDDAKLKEVWDFIKDLKSKK